MVIVRDEKQSQKFIEYSDGILHGSHKNGRNITSTVFTLHQYDN